MSRRVSAKDLSCIERFVLTEKSVRCNEGEGKVTFYVRKEATKPLIKAVLEEMFGFSVEKVWVIRVRGEKRRNRHGVFCTPNRKKVLVQVKGGFDMKSVLGV